jgi:virginiamycin B lyase
MVTIREHKIPSADSKPYIAIEGPDHALWFCESGASKIGRFDPDSGAFTEFALPAKTATPIGITPGADGNLWFTEKAINKIGRITVKGEITEFLIPSPYAGPDGIALGPDGNVWFSESEIRIRRGHFVRLAPAVDRGTRRRAVVQ